MQNGLKYVISKEGLIKLLVIALACTTFALLADTRYYRAGNRMEWVFAAFIVSFVISLLIYVFRVAKIADQISTCGPCTFDGFDFIWSWFSTMWCLAAAVIFAIEFNDRGRRGSWFVKVICSIILAFITGIVYGVEAYYLRARAPAHLGYISTRKGWLKTAIVALGAAAFALLVESSFPGCRGGCKAAITYVLVAYVVGWAVTVIIWILHIAGAIKGDQRSTFATVEFSWSVICILLFLSGSIVTGVYMHDRCNWSEYRGSFCQKRLSSAIIAAVNTVLYIIDAVLNKPVR